MLNMLLLMIVITPFATILLTVGSNEDPGCTPCGGASTRRCKR